MENQITPLVFSEKNTSSKFKDMKAGHVGIRTTKYNEILKCYVENLDFRIIRKWTVGEIQLAFIAPPNDNNFIIEVICYDRNEKFNKEEIKSGYNHLSFQVTDDALKFTKTTQVIDLKRVKVWVDFFDLN